MKKASLYVAMLVALAGAELLSAGNCTSDCPTLGAAGAAARVTLADSMEAAGRVDDLRAFFSRRSPTGRNGVATPPYALSAQAAPSSPLHESVATGLEQRDGGVGAVIPAEALRRVSKPASVTLPLYARDPVRLRDETSGVEVRFAFRAAGDARIAVAGGIALYAGGVEGGDVVHRVHAEGTEDYVVLTKRPAKEEIAYDVDVSRISGLRLVSNTVEFLDSDGTPRLRIAPPYVVDAEGERTEAELSVQGCAFDADPRAPWGRAVTVPGASQCEVRVTWEAAAYPAMIDPSWSATGSMSTARFGHTATLLVSGKVLVAGGSGPPLDLASAEVYDAGTGTFAATGSMARPRQGHTATLLASGRVLVCGDGDPQDKSAEVYDAAAGTFGATGSMSMARWDHTATLLGTGTVLIAGGYAFPPANTNLSAELYDSATGVFLPTGPMTTTRSHHTATLLPSGKVLLAGGSTYSTGVLQSTAEIYDPSGAGTFSPTGSMATPRQDHTATLLGAGTVLIVGGDGDFMGTAEIFDPKGAGSFSPAGSLATTRKGHIATLLGLASGEVLIAGGYSAAASPTVILNSTELYDPGSGMFVPNSFMTMTRGAPTATLLGSGAVLIAGGSEGEPTATAEVYDPTFSCANQPDGTSCDDQNACTQTDVCLGGVCAGTNPVVCPAPDACHMVQGCASGTGLCTVITAPDGTSCGTFGTEKCYGGVCNYCPPGFGNTSGYNQTSPTCVPTGQTASTVAAVSVSVGAGPSGSGGGGPGLTVGSSSCGCRFEDTRKHEAGWPIFALSGSLVVLWRRRRLKRRESLRSVACTRGDGK